MSPVQAVIGDILLTLHEMVNGAISTFRIQDAFDIVIMAFIIYHLVTLMKETRAGQLIKGVLVILLLYFFAYVLELYTLRTVMEMVIRYGALVLLVLFQPELRKVLEQVGRSSLSNLSVLAPNMNGGEQADDQDHQRHLRQLCHPLQGAHRGADGAGEGDQAGGYHLHRHYY